MKILRVNYCITAEDLSESPNRILLKFFFDEISWLTRLPQFLMKIKIIAKIAHNMEDIQDALPNADNVEFQRDEVEVEEIEEHEPRDREIVHVPQQNELRNNNVNEAAVGLDGRGRGRGAVFRQQRGPRRGGNPRQFGRRGQGMSGRRNDVRQLLQQQPNNFFGLVNSLFQMVVNAAQNSSSTEGGRGGRGGRGRGIRGRVRGRGQGNRGQRGGRGARGGRGGRGGRGRGQN
ncbi:unnamed protein product [Trichogramma brassicae]|uniref:Uncharacterized protein n=1 Tax=Trichogramma brassicae TaxID=86971 RepID=A0A6H5J6X2_9HYME|nr:unnamed protein product [Trichogramma brassicae]